MTLPSKEATTAHPGPEEPPKPRVEINEKSDDTIENIPSVKTKEGVSFESDSNANNSPAGTEEDGKLVPFVPGEMAKVKKKEVVVESKPAKSDSAKTATPAPPKKPEAVKNPNSPSLIVNKSKDPEKASKKKAPVKQSLIKESKYAGIQEKVEVKPPPSKLPSVMTLPSKEATTAHSAPEELPKARSKVEINEKSDDTIENIPSVKTKEGVSFEGESNANNSPAGTKEDGKLVPFVPGEMAKVKKK